MRKFLAGLGVASCLASSSQALALGDDQSAAGAPDVAAAGADGASLSDIIVTGTRRLNRTVGDSLAPIDVLSAKDLTANGRQSVRDLLGALVPSINVSSSGAGASYAVRTLSLRGLGGDQVLVLVNGKRRHNSATIFVNGTVQNGQSPPDLDLIPGNAIDRIEVLRDGASAQYGSDAIAGVINILLKKDEGGSAALTLGGTADNGGRQGRFQIDKGFALGADGGYFHLSADGILQQAALTRSSPIPGQLYPAGDPRNANPDRNRAKIGQPRISGGNFGYDAMLPLGGDLEVYSFGTFSKRHAAAWLTYRTPAAANNIIEVYPEGYTPRLHLRDTDFQNALGLRGELGAGVRFDLSTTYSRDLVKFSQTTSLNPSLGTASPMDFYLGRLRSDEWTTNLDISKTVDIGLAEPLSVAVGAEYRRNKFLIGEGEPASYINGGYVSPPGAYLAGQVRTGVGSQGVTGFLPSGSGSWRRNNWSAYVNVEGAIVDGVEVGLAGRHEDYSDFGTTDTGKASIRIEPVRGIAIRGTASTGFRAPTLQQQHYASSSTIGVVQNNALVLLAVQTLPPEGAAARALGAVPLKAEKSTSFSAGLVLTPAPNLNITVDAYQIRIRDRILLSETLTGPVVRSALQAAGINGIGGGLIFSNAADTRTRGLDIVGTYRADLGRAGAATVSLSANFNKTVFTHVDPVPAPIAASGLALIGRSRIGDLSEGTPRNKLIANVLWDRGDFNLNLRATRYGKITQRIASMVQYTPDFQSCTPVGPNCTLGFVDEVVKPRTLFDLEVGYRLAKGVKLSVGANNLFNVYPDKMKPLYRLAGTLYNVYAPYGISGGFYYGRLNLEF